MVVRQSGYSKNLRSRIIRSKFVLNGALLVLPLVAPLFVSETTASAAASFSNYPITSTYKNPGQVTTAGGSLWYIEEAPGATSSYDIGNMTTSGTTTDYNIRTLSGKPNLVLSSVTTGPDGNVWFAGGYLSFGPSVVGVLNISTGTVTTYSNSITAGDLPGPIVVGSDGNLYYTVNGAESTPDSYLFYVNPSTGTTTISHQYGVDDDLTGLTAGPDGNLWLTDYSNNTVQASPPRRWFE